MSYNSSGADNDIRAERHSGKYNRGTTDKHTIADCNRCNSSASTIQNERIIVADERGARDRAIVTDANQVRVQSIKLAAVDRRPQADPHAGPTVAGNTLLKGFVFRVVPQCESNATQDATFQLPNHDAQMVSPRASALLNGPHETRVAVREPKSPNAV